MDDEAGSMPQRAWSSDVLALATSIAPWSPAVVIGASIAVRWGGHLTGCFVEPSLRMLCDADTEPTVLGMLFEAGTGSAHDYAAFVAFAHEAGVPDAVWSVTRTGVKRTLHEFGAWHDLAVVERDMVDESRLVDVLGEAILTCRIPCLILPSRWDRHIPFERIVIGWSGHVQGARAIHAALPFLVDAKDVFLLDGEQRRPDDDRMDSPPRFDAFAYLTRHHISVSTLRIETSADMAGKTLLEQSMHLHADLLVMGAYGHSPIRECVFGGATRYVLEHASIPVLMRH